MNASLSEITVFIDALLDIKNVADWPNALNGLQFANMGRVAKIGAAVDACEAVLEMAAKAEVDLLLVHHGMFWGGLQPVTGAAYRKAQRAIRADLAVYSAHLPLDLHPALGNNALLARAIGLEATEPFFFEKGRNIGLKAAVRMPLDDLIARTEKATGGPVKTVRGGPAMAGRVGIVTGGAGGEVQRAAAEGVDTFITGEGPHHSALLAEELGVNLLLAGHYATETFGVKALAAHVAEKFGLPWQFFDYPTGL
ncbi:MAG TPA: Nif3-like dinuclear metal center hexameric protein [Chthoniobacteraceae bacterium]|jgi:dinuclear metal center YbgI/SA1388 family protein|nr:Nif3-like dinuclear metal center hexameric protein [Chthoniobacteraceae bacterium]